MPVLMPEMPDRVQDIVGESLSTSVYCVTRPLRLIDLDIPHLPYFIPSLAFLCPGEYSEGLKQLVIKVIEE